MTKRISLLPVLLLISICVLTANERLSLDSYDGTAWKVFPADGLKWNTVASADFSPETWVPGIVPGTVFVAYVEAGEEENPDWGDNVYRVDESKYNRSFWYRTTFARPQGATGHRTILTFEGIHKDAWVCFNGKKLGQVKGHVQRAWYDVTDLLRDENNVLAVRIDMPDKNHIARDASYVNYVCPTYVASHSWDWMPYVPGLNCGITNDVYLEFTPDITVRDTWVRTLLNDSYDRAAIAVQTDVVNLSEDTLTTTLTAALQSTDAAEDATPLLTASTTVSVPPLTTLTVSFDTLTLDCPQLWWPNGSGPQNLYTCKVQRVQNGEEDVTLETATFGVKRYEYRTENTALTLYVNGKKTFCKGGNWGMSDYLLRCHGSDYDRRLRLHADMHYNMIRLWTGCVTDEEFYEACDRYGIMVWDDFWLTGAFTGLTGPDDTKTFLANARDKVVRLRNHPSIAVWCGCNEGTPYDRLNEQITDIIHTYDADDRLYQPNSHYGNGLSGSGWWKNFPPEDYFSKGIWGGGGDKGDVVDWGFRSELGMAAFTTFESFREFMPEAYWWNGKTGPQNEMWEKHFFSDQAAYGGAAGATDYFKSVDTGYGKSSSAEEFCAKAQFLNIEVMKALYEGWQDNLWNTASGILFWMSQAAYPCFIWQTYDYYYDATGTYWGARKGCEPVHIQWNCSNQRINIVNTTPDTLRHLHAEIEQFKMNGTRYASNSTSVNDIEALPASVTKVSRFTATAPSGVYFIRLKLYDANEKLISENFYWKNRSGDKNDYSALNNLPQASLSCKWDVPPTQHDEHVTGVVTISNSSETTAFGIRVRLVDPMTGARILPVYMDENYFTLFAGESRTITLSWETKVFEGTPTVLMKQYTYPEVDAEGNETSIGQLIQDEDANANLGETVLYYDLYGRSISEPCTGIYIERDGIGKFRKRFKQ